MLNIAMCDDGKYRVLRPQPMRNNQPTHPEVVGGREFDTAFKARMHAGNSTHKGERINTSVMSYVMPPEDDAPKATPAPAAPSKPGTRTTPKQHTANAIELLTGKVRTVATRIRTGNFSSTVLDVLRVTECTLHPAKSDTDAAGRNGVISAIDKARKAL